MPPCTKPRSPDAKRLVADHDLARRVLRDWVEGYNKEELALRYTMTISTIDAFVLESTTWARELRAVIELAA